MVDWDKVRKSVVQIGDGYGVIVRSRMGDVTIGDISIRPSYIVTAAHILDLRQKDLGTFFPVSCNIDGEHFKADIWFCELTHDIAVLGHSGPSSPSDSDDYHDIIKRYCSGITLWPHWNDDEDGIGPFDVRIFHPHRKWITASIKSEMTEGFGFLNTEEWVPNNLIGSPVFHEDTGELVSVIAGRYSPNRRAVGTGQGVASIYSSLSTRMLDWFGFDVDM